MVFSWFPYETHPTLETNSPGQVLSVRYAQPRDLDSNDTSDVQFALWPCPWSSCIWYRVGRKEADFQELREQQFRERMRNPITPRTNAGEKPKSKKYGNKCGFAVWGREGIFYCTLKKVGPKTRYHCSVSISLLGEIQKVISCMFFWIPWWT